MTIVIVTVWFHHIVILIVVFGVQILGVGIIGALITIVVQVVNVVVLEFISILLTGFLMP